MHKMPRTPFSAYQRRINARTPLNVRPTPSHRWNRPIYYQCPMNSPLNMNPLHPTLPIQISSVIIGDNTLYATPAPPPNHNPHSWVKMSLLGHALSFNVEIEGRETFNNNSESDLPSSGSIGRNETNHGQLQSSPLDVLSAPTPTSSSSFSTPILPHSHLGATSLQPPGPDTSPEQPNRATVPASITGPRRRHELLDYFGSAHECATFSKPGSPKYGRQPSPGSSKQQCIFFLGVASEQNYIPSPYKPDPSTNSRCRRNRG